MAEPEWMKLAKQNPGAELDFQVRVHIIEARDLQPRDKNGMSDPVCVVRVFDKKKNTKVFQKTTSCTWDTLMFFELKMTAEEFFHGKINITVMDANTVLRDVEIGSYEFDVAYVHQEKGHELFRKWVALAYKSDNEKIRGRTNGIQGYLKLSLCVLGPQDQAPAHDENEDFDEEGSETDIQSMVLLPPTISAQDYALELYAYRAEGLPKMDTFGKCDGYVRVKFGGSKEQDTTIIKDNFNPQWLEKLTVPVQLPTMADLIKIQVWDYDKASKDELVATTYLRLNEIMKMEEWKHPRWVNLYGVPDGANPPRPSKAADLFDKINEGNVEGSNFRGRLLLSFRCVEALQPKASKVKVNSPADPTTAQYVFRFDVLEVSQLPKDSDISIEVTLGLFKQETGKFKVENGNCIVYESLPEQVLALPQDIRQVPDVFINVYRHLPLLGKKRIGYLRINPAELNDEFGIKSNTISPDPFADFDKSQALGFISYNLNLGISGKSIPRTTVSKPKFKKYQLRAHIYQGKDLPVADKEGTSDPYCVINLGKSSGKTKTLKETLFPIWYETVTFNVELPEGYNPEIHVSVWDWDRFDPDDFLGRFSVPTASVSDKLPEEPQWYPIYAKDSAMPEGSILASFQLIPEEKAASVAAVNITPKSRECTLQCSVIGLRELVPYDLLPINKPFVTIDAGLGTVVTTKGSNHPKATNPNFLESLNLKLSVPENPLFAPPINIKVFDDRLIHKPLIAARSVSTAPYIPWTATKIEVPDETSKPTVDVIPGAPKEEVEDLAKALRELTKASVSPDVTLEEETIDAVKLEIYGQKEDQSLNLITTTNEDIMTIHSDLMNCIQSSETTATTEEIVIKGEEDQPDERETVKTELEKTFDKKAFDVYKMHRSKKKNGKRYKVEVGEYKGQFLMVEGANAPPSKIAELYKQTPYVVRVYVLEGYQLVPKDTDGNNPYLKIRLGKTKIKDMDTAKQVTSRPQFYKCYEIPCIFPDETMLHLEVWDYDKFSSDDLIGSTSIDLEQRINSDEWKKLSKKPIEYRTLWNPVSSNPQGQLRLWVDILTPEEAAKNPPEAITPPAPRDMEVRVIVWDTRNVILKDNDGKRSDILVVGIMEGQQPQSTDTHWNSKDGTGMFNWRMKFGTKVPGPNSRLKLQVWDRNVLTPNGAICEANLNLRNFFMKSYKNKLNSLELEKQWVTMTHPAATGPQGEISVSIEVLTIEEAQKKPAGFGRDAPNDNPPLPEPNRPADSLAPWRLDKKMALGLKNFWGGNKWKIYGCLICVLVIIIAIIAIYFAVIF